MKNCILLSHVHVYDNESYKHSILSFALDHYRKHNPEDFIILTGHGLRPDDSILKKADYFIWEDTVRESEIGRGHPQLVDFGVQYAVENGFDYLVKCRADSIISIPNIVNHCVSILQKENKKMLVSLGTEKYVYGLGDLFVCCPPILLEQTWNPAVWDYRTNGLQNFGLGAFKKLNFPVIDDWMSFLREHFSYLDPENLGWVDLLGPHPHDGSKWQSLIQNYGYDSLIENKIDYSPYMWGKDWGQIPEQYLNEEYFYNG